MTSNEPTPSDPLPGGGTVSSTKVPEEVREEVAPDAEKQMELILQKKAENDRLRKIRRQNASGVMEHVCNNVLDLGSYECHGSGSWNDPGLDDDV